MLLSRTWQHSCVSTRYGRLAPEQRFVASNRVVMAHAARVVPPAEAAALLTAGTPYVDVRTPEEFAAGHAPGAVNVPFMLKSSAGMAPNPSFLDAFGAQFGDKGRQLLVACQSGKRSAAAAAALGQAGYTELIDVGTGFSGWQAAGLPIEK